MKNISMKTHYKTELVFNLGLDQHKAINNLDKDYVGTQNYMGFAYFWDHAVKHALRDATPYQRVKVHKLFMANDIPFDKKEKYFISNKDAEKIVNKVCTRTL